jgi:hypothetical protein
VIAFIREVFVGGVFDFHNGWERRQDSPGGYGAISKCAHHPQSRQSYRSGRHDETIPPARSLRIIVIVMLGVNLASFGCLDIVTVAVIGGDGPQRSFARGSAKTDR